MEHSNYIVFVDESGDHSLESIDNAYPVFVLCFCIFKKNDYIYKATPKIKFLKIDAFGHDLIVLHESDIRKKRGNFSHLNKLPRDAFLNSLNHLIKDLDFSIIAVIIDKVKFKERYSVTEHPYHLALEIGLERLHDYLKNQGETNKTPYIICEARGAREDSELELAFRRVCDGVNQSKNLYAFKMYIADKKTNSEGLQIADLVARPIGLSVIKPNQSNRAYEIIKHKLYSGRDGSIENNGKTIFP